MEEIKQRIFTIRGKQVMLDKDLAIIYNIPTKFLNQAVQRNKERFPEKFMFKLTEKEVVNLKFQFKTSKMENYQILPKEAVKMNSSRSQIVTLDKLNGQYSWYQNGTLNKISRGHNVKYLPYAFTEQGVAMLSAVLKSKTAVEVSVRIMDAFVEMRKFLIQNAEVFQRLDSVESKQLEYDKNFEKVFQALEDKTIPNKGIFFNGQVFEAYSFIANLIRAAKKSIILIDNYVDDSVLILFSKTEISVTIYTKITKQLELDFNKYKEQYFNVKIIQFNQSHDRFLIIDNEVYHFGASLKDLGKKWFAFSKFDKEALVILEKLKILQN